MSDLLPITIDEQIAEAEREVAMRRRVYAQWVSHGRMTQRKADRQIAVMEQIAKTLIELKSRG